MYTLDGQRWTERRVYQQRRADVPNVDVLQRVALHGQYHTGKINLLLRQSGDDAAPTDFIAYVRGVPATVTRLEYFGYGPYVCRSLQRAAASL